MRFTVPQFIERETPIVGPLTFRQFLIIGVAGGIVFFLYFSIGKTSFLLFLILAITLMSVSLALAFLQIGGRSLLTILGNFLRFSLSSKTYLWKKKEVPIMVFKKEVIKEEVKEELPLKIAEKSQLKKIKTEIETKTK